MFALLLGLFLLGALAVWNLRLGRGP
jgi:hypothetical protein